MLSRKGAGLAVGIALWAAGVAAGFGALQRYSAQPGPTRAPVAPAEFFAAQRQPGRALLVMAVHPGCPCTAASLAELGDLLARSHGACDAVLLNYRPEQEPPGWPLSSPPRELGGVPVRALEDRGGKLATRLGASTSGHVVFADAQGTLRYAGGLTISRGHRGRAPGQDAILEILAGGSPALNAAPVYGCALESPCGAENCP